MLMTETVSVISPSVPQATSPETLRQSRLMEAMRAQYQADQQVEYLHLQAETELLLQQLQALKRQRETVEHLRVEAAVR